MDYIKKHWRGVLAVLPLPTLALAASYGVWSFNSLYLPFWAAFVMAASFELVYLGLAVARLTPEQRKRATRISYGAVVVSVVYNTLAGVAHRQPEWFTNLPPQYEWLMAFIHGAPLAIVAYLVSDLLIHREIDTSNATETTRLDLAFARVPEQPTYPDPVQVESVSLPLQSHNETLPSKHGVFTLETFQNAVHLGETISPAEMVQRLGASRATINRLIDQAIEIGVLVKEGRGVYRVV